MLVSSFGKQPEPAKGSSPRSRKRRLRGRRARCAGSLMLAWLTATSLAGCGDGDDAPLPPGGVFESQLGEAPPQALTFDHTAVYRLEAAGDYEGDSGQEEGVDEIPYVIDQPTD